MGRVKLDFDDEEDVVSTAPANTVAVDQLQPNPENPRPTDLAIEDTAERLKAKGQLQNINIMSREAFLAVKPHLADDLGPEPYVVINGCRRLAAARKAGLGRLRFEEHNEWSENDVDEALITENDDRVDLNPMLLGQHLARMVHRYGSARKLAQGLGKTQPWVSQRIGLTELHPALQQAVLDERIRFKVVRECTRLHPELQPLLASGELQEDIVQAWLTEERIKPDEQLERWKAGPPYLASAVSTTAPSTDAGRSEYRVFTPEEASPNGGDHQSVGSNGELGASSAESAGEYPVFTEQREDTPSSAQRAKDGVTITTADRSPQTLAAALRKHLSADELSELARLLVN